MIPTLAHGVGGRTDLPLPVWLFMYGAAFALLISFVALRILWPKPRLAQLAMGRAIVREPAVFLFDEPLSNLDAKLRVQMRFEIQKLHRRLGTTSLYVTHDQVEAMTLAQRMIVMNAGRAEQVGTPMQVYSNPATTFVAGFIGSPAMNFLEGKSEGGGKIALDGSGSVTVPNKLDPGRRVTVGIRPEHLMPSKPSERTRASAISSACSPVSGCEMYRLSTSTPQRAA